MKILLSAVSQLQWEGGRRMDVRLKLLTQCRGGRGACDSTGVWAAASPSPAHPRVWFAQQKRAI